MATPIAEKWTACRIDAPLLWIQRSEGAVAEAEGRRRLIDPGELCAENMSVCSFASRRYNRKHWMGHCKRWGQARRRKLGEMSAVYLSSNTFRDDMVSMSVWVCHIVNRSRQPRSVMLVLDCASPMFSCRTTDSRAFNSPKAPRHGVTYMRINSLQRLQPKMQTVTHYFRLLVELNELPKHIYIDSLTC